MGRFSSPNLEQTSDISFSFRRRISLVNARLRDSQSHKHNNGETAGDNTASYFLSVRTTLLQYFVGMADQQGQSINPDG
jgi:hypothetical protein